MWNERILRDLAVFYGVSILPLDGFHLIFEPQFKFLQPDFFQFFVIGEIPLVGERRETLLILRVLLGQLAERFVTGQEMVSRD
jgi:hypothetical protein